MSNEMQTKVVMITGATNGIGLEAAKMLAAKGATIVGVGRNPQKCMDAANQIAAVSGNTRIEFLIADLSRQTEVRRAAAEFKGKYDRLDVLLNNAGAYFANRETNADGQEMTWALNHLNYFVLTDELLDVLKASGSARIVNVSSDAHRPIRGIRFEDVELRTSYNGWLAYGQSKLANVMFTYELARRLAGAQVTANVLHPGFVATGFGLNNGGLINFGMKVIQRIGAKRPEQGAATSVYLASSPEVEGVSGRYFADSKATRSNAASHDVAAQHRLWELSEQYLAARAAA